MKVTYIRFLKEDLDTVKMKLNDQIKEQDENVDNLKKKQTYLETTYKNAQSHIQDILGRR
jgi:FtsZ-binding cell division protein ZapB